MATISVGVLILVVVEDVLVLMATLTVNGGGNLS